MNQREIQQHLGSVIRRRRKQLELRQQDLAAQLGISRGSLANIEIGKQGVLVHQLYSFAEALGLRPEDFLAPLPDKTNPLQEPWAEAIPADLKLEQRKQIARLIGDQREPQKGE